MIGRRMDGDCKERMLNENKSNTYRIVGNMFWLSWRCAGVWAGAGGSSGGISYYTPEACRAEQERWCREAKQATAKDNRCRAVNLG